MKKINIFVTSAILSLVVPVTTFAFFGDLKTMVGDVKVIVDKIYIIVFSLALIFFFWGMGQFILKAGDAKMREEGKQKMIWGVVVIFVMFSIFGIITFIGDELGIASADEKIPSLVE